MTVFFSDTHYNDRIHLTGRPEKKTMIFTSRRPGSTGGKMDPEDNQYYEDIYITKKKNGSWIAPKPIGESINSTSHEATIGLTVDGQELLIYRGDVGEGDLYHSKLTGDKWGAPVKSRWS